ncbi:unannotated protein [freshwater metagenome]|uniref:Unannotated protein n=1 Tax=freshwater metagenome TaxID=449393 RepID=A0A6J7IFZ6_9ZZZZ
MGSGDGDVEAVGGQEELKSAGEFLRTGRGHRHDDGDFLAPLELVDGADLDSGQSGLGEGAADEADLRVVGGDDDDVVLGDGPGGMGAVVRGAGPGPADEVGGDAVHLAGFFGARGGVAVMRDRHRGDARADSVQMPERGDGRGPELSFVLKDRHGPGERRVHAVGAVEEVAAIRGHGCGAVRDVREDGRLDPVGVGGLADLWELLRVAEEQHPVGGEGAGDGIGQGVLAGLVDDKQIQVEGLDGWPGKRPGGTADDIAARHGRRPVMGLASDMPWLMDVAAGLRLLADRHGGVGLADTGKEVVDDGMGLRDDADAPPRAGETGNGPGSHVCLPGARRALHGNVGVIGCLQGNDDVVDRVTGHGKGAASCRRACAQQVSPRTGREPAHRAIGSDDEPRRGCDGTTNRIGVVGSAGQDRDGRLAPRDVVDPRLLDETHGLVIDGLDLGRVVAARGVIRRRHALGCLVVEQER